MEMLLTGEFIDAATAQQRALINRVAPADALQAEVERLVASILNKPAAAVRMGKALFYRQVETGIDAAYQLAAQTMTCNMLDDCALEGVQAFIEKREPSWRVASGA
jgi:Dihydroxynaphthoic acid synthase